MKSIWIFDIYTAEVFGVFVGSFFFGWLGHFFTQRFPSFMDRATNFILHFILPFAVLLLLGFCGLQIADAQRTQANVDHPGVEK